MAESDQAEVRIPAGAFFMGRSACDMFSRDAEQPLRAVKLKAFAIDVHSVTNGRYRPFVEAGGYEQPELWSRDG